MSRDLPGPKVELVHRLEHEQALAQLEVARRQVNALNGVVRRLARTNPRGHEWEQSYRALQKEARTTLAALGAASS